MDCDQSQADAHGGSQATMASESPRSRSSWLIFCEVDRRRVLRELQTRSAGREGALVCGRFFSLAHEKESLTRWRAGSATRSGTASQNTGERQERSPI